MRALGMCALLFVSSAIAAAKLNTAKIEELTGAKGKLDEKEGVFKVDYPRKDIKAEAAGVKLIPPLGLTAWAAFTQSGNHTMVMGDIVLTEPQVDAVMDTALENGLEVTALHNHFFYDKPKIMFMHVGGMGDQEKLAAAVGKIFAKIKETESKDGPAKEAKIDPAKTSLDPKKIEKIMGHSGDMKDGVYKITIGRTTKMEGHQVGKTMGVNTWAAFAGSDNEAVVDGDFAMTGREVQTILKTLRKGGISVVALHNHMIGESPQIFFLHMWGVGPTEDLARGIRAALDTQKLAE